VDVILRDILVFLQSGDIWRHVLDLIDIGLVAFFLYRMFLLIRGTQAVQLMFGVLLLALIGLLANLLDLRLLSWIFRNAAPAILIGIIVLFQPEIRRALDQFGRIGFIGRPLAHYNLQIFNRMIDEVIRATTKLTQRFTGALIVFEKETGLENYANSGIRINGELTAEFLEAIFFPNSPLHDGAVIVRGNQILAAGCVLPLAEEGTVRERMGTRHRAGLGLSMQTDAVVLILSEELGQIAVAHEGKLLRNLDPDRLRQVLTSLLQPRPEIHRPPLPVWRR
jgi:diadenylate cyclase